MVRPFYSKLNKHCLNAKLLNNHQLFPFFGSYCLPYGHYHHKIKLITSIGTITILHQWCCFVCKLNAFIWVYSADLTFKYVVVFFFSSIHSVWLPKSLVAGWKIIQFYFVIESPTISYGNSVTIDTYLINFVYAFKYCTNRWAYCEFKVQMFWELVPILMLYNFAFGNFIRNLLKSFDDISKELYNWFSRKAILLSVCISAECWMWLGLNAEKSRFIENMRNVRFMIMMLLMSTVYKIKWNSITINESFNQLSISLYSISDIVGHERERKKKRNKNGIIYCNGNTKTRACASTFTFNNTNSKP